MKSYGLTGHCHRDTRSTLPTSNSPPPCTRTVQRSYTQHRNSQHEFCAWARSAPTPALEPTPKGAADTCAIRMCDCQTQWPCHWMVPEEAGLLGHMRANELLVYIQAAFDSVDWVHFLHEVLQACQNDLPAVQPGTARQSNSAGRRIVIAHSIVRQGGMRGYDFTKASNIKYNGIDSAEALFTTI